MSSQPERTFSPVYRSFMKRAKKTVYTSLYINIIMHIFWCGDTRLTVVFGVIVIVRYNYSSYLIFLVCGRAKIVKLSFVL